MVLSVHAQVVHGNFACAVNWISTYDMGGLWLRQGKTSGMLPFKSKNSVIVLIYHTSFDGKLPNSSERTLHDFPTN